MAPPLVRKLPKVTEYVRNVGKSIEYATIDYLKGSMEETSSFVENNQELFRDIAAAAKNYKATLRAADKSIRQSKIYEAGSELKKNLFESIRTGKFYDMDREAEYQARASGSLGDMSDMDDWSFDSNQFDIDSGDMSTEDSTGIISSAVKDATTAQSQVIAKSAEYMAEMNKASTRLLFTQGEKLYSTVSTGLAGTQSMLERINAFLDGPLTTHLNNSTEFYKATTDKLNEITGYIKEMTEMQRNLYKREQAKDQESQYSKVGSSPDLKEYAKQVKKNLMDALPPEAQMLLGDDMGDGSNMLLAFVANPLRHGPDLIARTLVPATIKQSLHVLDASFSNLFTNFIARMNRMAKDDLSDNPIFKFIGKLFGLRTDTKTGIDTSKYEKGPVPFDGITRKAIVDIIPGHLARIEAALTGKTERVYDFETGKWTTIDKIEKSYKDRKKNAVRDATWDVGEDVRDYINYIKKSNEAYAARLQSDYETITKKIYEDSGVFEPYKAQGHGEDKQDPWDYYGVDKATFMRLAKLMVGSADDVRKGKRKTNAYGLAGNVLDSIEREARYWRDAEKSGVSTYRYLYDESHGSGGTRKTSNANNIIAAATDQYNKNVFWYLRGIYAELSQMRSDGGFGGGSGGKGPSGGGGTIDPRAAFEQRLKDELDSTARKVETASTTNTTNENYKSEDVLDREFDDWYDAHYGEMPKSASEAFLTQLLKADSLGAKFKVITKNLGELTKKPGLALAGVIDTADKRIFQLVFGGKEGEEIKDKEGNTVRGFLDYLILRTQQTFDKMNDWLDENILNPLKEKLGIESFGELFKRLADKTGLTKAAGFVKDKVQTWTRPTIDRMKAKLGWGASQVKGSLSRTYGAAWNKAKAQFAPAGPTSMRFSDYYKANRGDFNSDDVAAAWQILKENNYSEEAINFVREELGVPDYVLFKAHGGLVTRRGLAVISPGEKVVPVGGRVTQRNNLVAEKAFARRLGLPPGLSYYAAGTGDKTDEEIQKAKETVKKVTSEVMGDTQHKGIANVIASSLLGGGFSLLTGLIGGPLLGAAAGAAFGITQNSGTVQRMLFGEDVVDEKGNPTGEKKGGLISQDLQNKFKKYFPSMKDFGIAGALAGLFTPFGLVGGLMIGSAVGFAKENDQFQEWVFGKKDEKTGERDGGLLKKEFREKVKKAAPRMLIGAAGAALLGPFGILGNAVLGSALGFTTTTQKFHEVVFGKEDENGEKRGGILPAIYRGIIKPLYKTGKNFIEASNKFLKEKVFSPITNFVPAFIQMMKNGMVSIGDHVKDFLSNMFERSIGRPIYDFLEHTIFDNVRKWAGRLLKAPLAIAKGAISAPFAALNFVGNNIRGSQIAKGTAGDMTAQQRLDWRDQHKIRVFGREIVSHDRFRNLDEKLAGLKGNAGIERMEQMRDQMKLYLDTKGELGRQIGEKVRKAGEKLSDFLNYNTIPGDDTVTIYQAVGSKGVKPIHKAIRDGKVNDIQKALDKFVAKGFMTAEQEAELMAQLNPIMREIIDAIERRKNAAEYQKQIQGRLGRLTGGTLSNTRNIRRFSRLLDNEIDARKAEEAKRKAENPEEAAAETINETIDKSTKSIVDVLSEINENIKLNNMTKRERQKYLADKQKEKEAADAAANASEESYEDDGMFSGDTDTDTDDDLDYTQPRRGLLGRIGNKIGSLKNRARSKYSAMQASARESGSRATQAVGNTRLAQSISNTAGNISSAFSNQKNKLKQYGEFITGGEKDVRKAFKHAFHMVTTKDGRAALADAKGKIVGTSGASAVGKEIKEEAAADKAERKTILDNVKGIGTSIIGGAGKLIGKAKDGIFSMISGIVNNTGIVGKAIKLLGGAGLAAIAIAGVGHFSEFWKEKIWPTLSKFLGNIFDKIKGVVSNIYNWLADTFPTIFGEDSFIGKAVATIKDFFADPAAGLKKAFNGIVNWFKEGFSLFNKNIIQPAWEWLAPRITTAIYNAIHSASLAEALNKVSDKSVTQAANQRVNEKGEALYYDEDGNTTTERYDKNGNEREAVIDDVSVIETTYANSLRNFDLGHMSKKKLQREATISGYKFTYLEYNNGDIVIRSENTGEYIRIDGGVAKGKKIAYGVLKDASGNVSNGALIGTSVVSGTIGLIAGGLAGAAAAGAISGTTIGAAVGSVLPGIGNVIGAVAGVLVGAGIAVVGYALSGGGYSAESKININDAGAAELMIAFGLDPSGKSDWPVVSDSMETAIQRSTTDEFKPDYGDSSTTNNSNRSLLEASTETTSSTSTTTTTTSTTTSTRGTSNSGFSENARGAGFSANAGSNRGRSRDHLYQGDPRLENVPFGNSTLGDAGCGPVALTNLLRQYGMARGDNSDLAAAAAMALPYQTSDGGITPDYFTNALNGAQTDKKSSIMKAIKNGRPTVLLGKSNREQGTPFGANDHYITAMGMDNRGNVIVEDPDLPGSTYKYPASKVMNDTTTGVISGMRRGHARRRGFRRLCGFDRATDQSQQVSKLAIKGFEITRQFEGNYSSVNKNDNGSLSIGRIQWHGPRAFDLVRDVINAVGASTAISILGQKLYNEVANGTRTDWNNRTVNQSEADKIGALISTEAGKKIQDDKACIEFDGYLSAGKKKGITDENALCYYADLTNQGGPGGANRVADAAIKLAGSASRVTLDIIHQAALSDKVFKNYAARRNKCYEALKNSKLVGTTGVTTVDSLPASSGSTSTTYTSSSSSGNVGVTSQGADAIADMIASNIFGSSLISGIRQIQNKNYNSQGFVSSTLGGSTGGTVNVPTNGYGVVGSPTQQGLVDQMASIAGKIKYSLGATQDPDKGIASCASTVGWAYRKVLGLNDPWMSASSTTQSKDSRFTTIWTNNGSGFNQDSILQPGDVMYYNWDQTRNNGTMQHTEMYAGNGQDWNHGGNPEYGPVLKNLDSTRRKNLMMVRRYNGFIGNDSSGSRRRRGYARTMTSGVSANISSNAKKIISQYGISTGSSTAPVYTEVPTSGDPYTQFLAVIIDLLAAIADNTKSLTAFQNAMNNRGVNVDYSTLQKAAANARRRSGRGRGQAGYKPTMSTANTFSSADAQDLMNSPTGFMVQAMEALASE